MRKPFFFLLFLLSFKREVSGIMQFNQQDFENTGALVNDARQHRRFLEDDYSYEQGSTQENIDLSDMLNFERPLTRSEFNRLIRAESIERRRAAGEHEDNREYDDDEISALLEEDEELKMQVREYLIRYVNLFLNLLELKERREMGESDEETIDFDFVISSRDLRALQDLAENFDERSVFDQLYVIDSIISKGIRLKPKRSFYRDVVNTFSKAEFSREFFISKTSYFYIFVGIGVTLILIKNFVGVSYKFIGFVMINNLILMEGLFNYFRKIKEADIADYVDRMKYNTEYDACNPEGQSIFGKLYDLFYENQCLTYHKNLQLSRADSIFPLESILNAYSFYLIEIPCKVLGTGINAFVVSVNAYLPMVARQLGEVTTQFCLIGFLLVALILYLITPQFTISVMGSRFQINFGRYALDYEPEKRKSRQYQYRRSRRTTRAALNEIETRNNYESYITEYAEEDSDSFTEEIPDIQEAQPEIEEIEDSSFEDDIEILDEHVVTDDESLASEENNFSEDAETAEGLPSKN